MDVAERITVDDRKDAEVALGPPVLLLADIIDASSIVAASPAVIAWTTTDDHDRARALESTGGFVAIFVAGMHAHVLATAVVLDPTASPMMIAAAVKRELRRAATDGGHDHVGDLLYDEYVELARYATTRRYLISLMRRHHGSVTHAAHGAKMKRESLHRLLRRHHLVAEDYRDR